jgi:Uma2 family endonuclease
MMKAMGTITKPMTFAEFEELPDAPGKRELLDGELIELPPAKQKHLIIQHRIADVLRRYLAGRDLGTAYVEAGFYLATRHWVQPDASIVFNEQGRRSDPDGYLEGAPALAVEVISRGNTAESVDNKIAKYFENGAREVWVWYPKTRRVHLYRDAFRNTVVTGAGTLISEAFPGLEVPLDDIFGNV